MVPLVAAGSVVQVHPARIVVATGAAEAHGVLHGNDLPGVWLGRGAARLAGVHRVSPGERAVVVVTGDEGLEHLRTLSSGGRRIIAVVPAGLADRVPVGVQAVVDARVIRVAGHDVGHLGRGAQTAVATAGSPATPSCCRWAWPLATACSAWPCRANRSWVPAMSWSPAVLRSRPRRRAGPPREEKQTPPRIGMAHTLSPSMRGSCASART